jgi:hypothetical protein
MDDKYYQIIIGEVKDRPFHEADELIRVWHFLVQDQFPDFDKKKYRSERGANMAMERIKKHFPDIPLEMLTFVEV